MLHFVLKNQSEETSVMDIHLHGIRVGLVQTIYMEKSAFVCGDIEVLLGQTTLEFSEMPYGSLVIDRIKELWNSKTQTEQVKNICKLDDSMSAELLIQMICNPIHHLKLIRRAQETYKIFKAHSDYLEQILHKISDLETSELNHVMRELEDFLERTSDARI